jgi:hypothetical protein
MYEDGFVSLTVISLMTKINPESEINLKRKCPTLFLSARTLSNLGINSDCATCITAI